MKTQDHQPRNTMPFYVMAFMICMIFFSACKKSEIGPEGPQGPKGEQGQPGVADVRTILFSNVGQRWQAQGTESPTAYAVGYSYVAELIHGQGDAFHDKVFNYGAVLVYYNDFNSYQWKALPGSVYGNAYQVSYMQSRSAQEGIIWLMSKSTATTTQTSPGTYIDDVKVVMIGGDKSVTGTVGRSIPLSQMPPMDRARYVCPALREVDLNDYEAVKKALKLKD